MNVPRACIHIANANLRLRMQRPHSVAHLFGDALAELQTLNSRKTAMTGDGFVESFPVAPLVALLQVTFDQPQLSKADWVALGRRRGLNLLHETKCMHWPLWTRRALKDALLCI